MISLVINFLLPDHSQVIGKNNLLNLLSNTGGPSRLPYPVHFLCIVAQDKLSEMCNAKFIKSV